MDHNEPVTAANTEQLNTLFELLNSVEGVSVSGTSMEEVRESFRRARQDHSGAEGPHADHSKVYR